MSYRFISLQTSLIIEALVIVLSLSFASAARAEPAPMRQQSCERLLLQPTMAGTPAAEVMRARRKAKTLAIAGLVTWGAGYAASIITTGILSFGRLAISTGSSDPNGSGTIKNRQTFEHWTEPLIPFVGAFLFAGHADGAGYVALGVGSGLLQVLGALMVVYGLWTRPASPCEVSTGLRLDATGLTLRF
ncbi:MAG TPA: hypothetical protein VFN67_14815 [Polyangiales bacterium]|jgi:uncharacterized membrane protein YphA (DoxX/SURF4 family)|nr:hypothetical protein [Polyangiales bacterium]